MIIDSDLSAMLFKIVVNKMPRPQEVIVNFDENGMPRKETVEDTESSNKYSVARRILINLAETNWEQVDMIFLGMIQEQGDQHAFSPETLNHLSWSLGTMHEVLTPENEKKYLTKVLRVLGAYVEPARAERSEAAQA
jgi:hypothetical protein